MFFVLSLIVLGHYLCAFHMHDKGPAARHRVDSDFAISFLILPVPDGWICVFSGAMEHDGWGLVSFKKTLYVKSSRFRRLAFVQFGGFCFAMAGWLAG